MALALVAGRQHHAEIIVTHVGREIVADDAFGTRAGPRVDDGRLQHLDQRKRIVRRRRRRCISTEMMSSFDGITIGARVVPVRQVVEAVVDHAEGVAQVSRRKAARQIGEIGGDARALGGLVVLVEWMRVMLKVKVSFVMGGVHA